MFDKDICWGCGCSVVQDKTYYKYMCDDCEKIKKEKTTTVDSAVTILTTLKDKLQKSTQSEMEAAFEAFFPLKKEPTKYPHSKDMSLGEMYDNFFPKSDTSQTRAMLKELERLEEINRKTQHDALMRDAVNGAKKVRATALANAKQALNDAFTINRTLVVNLFAGPGAGKSTMAAGIFYDLKNRGVNCELTMEFAKDLTWEERHDTFKDQVYIFGKQYHRIFRLIGKVDVIITDSPLLLTPIYDAQNREELKALALAEHKKMHTYNVFLRRKKDFNPKGRVHNEEEAIALDKKIKDFLDIHEQRHVVMVGDEWGKNSVVQSVINILQNKKVI